MKFTKEPPEKEGYYYCETMTLMRLFHIVRDRNGELSIRGESCRYDLVSDFIKRQENMGQIVYWCPAETLPTPPFDGLMNRWTDQILNHIDHLKEAMVNFKKNLNDEKSFHYRERKGKD